jgi:hypothetical protein
MISQVNFGNWSSNQATVLVRLCSSCCVSRQLRYCTRMTTILEVQDGILKVQGELEELRKRLQEEVPEAERAHLWKKEEQLIELLIKREDHLVKLQEKELLLMQSGQNSTALLKDRSGEWIKHMLMPGLTTLPQHDYDLAINCIVS